MFQKLFQTFIKFLYSPVLFPEMLWILIPLLLSIILMHLYFERYSRKTIGSHKSLENSIFMIFISFNLLSYVILSDTSKLNLVISYSVFSCIIGLLDYYHKLSTSFLYKFSAKFYIAFISYIIIILVYSDIMITSSIFPIIFSILILLFIFILIKKIISFLEPNSENIEHHLKHIEEDIKEAHKQVKDK